MRRRAACALLMAVSLAACGKAGNSSSGASGERDLNPVVAAGIHGAAGQITKNTARLGGSTAVVDAAAVATAAYPGLTPAGRPQAVVVANRANFYTALAASALAGAPLQAPLLYSDSTDVPDVTSQALAAMAPTGASGLGGAKLVAVGGAEVPANYLAYRVSATEPFAAAAEIARLGERLRGSAPQAVIVVNAEGSPAMAMPAAGLAAESGAPILLVSNARVPAPTHAVLKRLDHPTIFAIGPAGTISEAVLGKLEHLGTVRRIAGAAPAENAIEVARFSEGAESSEFGFGVHEAGHGLVFANALRPLDAPAAATLSATGDFAPLLLLEGASSLPPVLASYLNDIQGAYSQQVPPTRGVYNHGWIIGDELAVSATVAAQLDAALEIVKRSDASTPSFHP